MSIIRGIKKFTDKKGEKRCILFVESEFLSFDKSNADMVAGNKVEQEWLESAVAAKLDASCIGKTCTIIKEVSGNRAYITDIIIK